MRKSAWIGTLSLAALAAFAINGCKSKPKTATVIAPRYQAMGLRDVPPWLKGSIYEQVELINVSPALVSGYGLVVNLDGTGDSTAPNSVRKYIIKQMQTRGFGNKSLPGFENLDPDRVLGDPRVAIVRVDGFIPPGAKKGDFFDVQVSTLNENNTSSLAGGSLYLTDIAAKGADPYNPTIVERDASAQGPLFVNPAYAVHADLQDPEQARSLRKALVMGGGVVFKERPLALFNRSAERRMARMLEDRIDLAFQDSEVASAQDEGRILIRVPARFKGDWEHFSGVMLHTFFTNNDGFSVIKAKELIAEAHKPGAPLQNISYALEALGPAAISTIAPMMTDPNPEIAFAATRAAAFLGDPSAPLILSEMAMTKGNPYRVNAVETLAALTASPQINQALQRLLSADESLVRIAAYKALNANNDTGGIFTRRVPSSEYQPEAFQLQLAQSDAAPIVYATRSGYPTIAIIGDAAQLKLPTFHSALDDRLLISSDDRNVISISQRATEVGKQPINVRVRPDLQYVIAALGGENMNGQPGVRLNYNQVVGLLMDMASQNKLQSAKGGQSVAFVLEDLAPSTDVLTAPVIPAPTDQRPVSEAKPRETRAAR